MNLIIKIFVQFVHLIWYIAINATSVTHCCNQFLALFLVVFCMSHNNGKYCYYLILYDSPLTNKYTKTASIK